MKIFKPLRMPALHDLDPEWVQPIITEGFLWPLFKTSNLAISFK
jgi:hypothetical protein